MTIKEIINTTTHRPWKMPSGSWRFYQEWNNAIFLHWQVELGELEKFVPKDLEIDLHDGNPWVSMVAFTMEKIRPKGLPYFPPISNFDEINLRTYVKSNNKAGVYFLSIEGAKRLSCQVAKSISGLPYRYSQITRTDNQCHSFNSEYKDRLDLEFTIGAAVQKKSVSDKWLTERYALFQDTTTSINEFEIHHLEWPIHEMEVKKLNLSYQRFHRLINNKPDKIHYSKGVKVLAWGKNCI
jgi:uncharacterized protein